MNTLYTQLPDLFSAGDPSTTPRSNRRRQRASSQHRRRTRANQHAFSFDPSADLEDDLGVGYSAFADMFGRSDSEPSSGVDFGTLLRTIVTEGQRQGIDALSALRAAGRVQDELRRFQQDPTAWFEGVGDRFRAPATPDLDDGGGSTAYNTRARSRRQQQQQRRGANVNANQPDSWWSNVASGVNDFFKRDPDQPDAGRSNRRNRRTSYGA